MDLQTVIRLSIEECGRTQGKIADELGISESALSMIKYGDRQLPSSLIIPLARATGDDSIIQHLNARAGLISCTPPAVPRDDLEPVEAIAVHEHIHNIAPVACMDHLRYPGNVSKQRQALVEAMAEDLRLHDLVRRYAAPELHIDMEAYRGR